MSHNQYFEYSEMILMALDGQMDDEQFAEFDRLLQKNSEFRQYYLKFMAVNASLGAIDKFPSSRLLEDQYNTVFNQDLWRELARHEQTAETIEIEPPERKNQIVKIQHVERAPRKINKFSLVSAIISIAALFFLLLYVHFVPVSQSTEIATLVDGINAVWSGSDRDIAVGKRFMTNQLPVKLEQGIAKLLFDNRAEIIIEAPARFQILTREQIQLDSGRLYARIPQEALGFSVNTPNAKIVDLGTEFGVQVDTLENTELHVLKGKTNLYYGVGKSKEISLVSEGNATKISSASDRVVNIPCQKTTFVRQIDSTNNLVWKGENVIDLADIVNGGNGLGTGRRGRCIDPATGDLVSPDEVTSGSWDEDASYVRPVADLPAVDCVVVPSQNGGDLPIATTGLSLPDFPPLLGDLRWPIQTQTYQTQYPLVLNGQTYGTDEHPAILVHATCGITFDLDAIRQHLPNCDLALFKTMCGINESRLENNFDSERTADVYIYLDGKQVFRKTILHVQNNAVPIQINLREENSRFLTLLVSCAEYGNDFDWCIFGMPQLLLGDR